MKIRVKSFSVGFNSDLKEVNAFLDENDLQPVSVSVFPMHDYYSDGRGMCNQWQEVILLYREKTPNAFAVEDNNETAT